MCGISLLATQKSKNRPGWWKGKFTLFQMLATGMGRVVDICPKARQGVRAFIDRVGGGGRLYAEKA